jgi:hypothetical protein
MLAPEAPLKCQLLQAVSKKLTAAELPQTHLMLLLQQYSHRYFQSQLPPFHLQKNFVECQAKVFPKKAIQKTTPQ